MVAVWKFTGVQVKLYRDFELTNRSYSVVEEYEDFAFLFHDSVEIEYAAFNVASFLFSGSKYPFDGEDGGYSYNSNHTPDRDVIPVVLWSTAMGNPPQYFRLLLFANLTCQHCNVSRQEGQHQPYFS